VFRVFGVLRVLAGVGCLLVAASSLGVGDAAGQGASAQRVLFIGNSLTAANNLPAMVEAIAAGAGGATITTRTVAVGGYSLEDHWARGEAQKAIAAGGWSFVVLQQGPSALPESQVSLRTYTRRFNELVVRAGARTALYMVWPARARSGDFDGVSASYSRAAQDVSGLLLPVGDAWRAAWRRNPSLRLYGDDDFHPSPAGSYLAALVIYQRLTGRSPIGLPPRLVSPSGAFPPVTLTPDDARVFQEAAQAPQAP
jgi:hypothetical protein